mgnify:CR=1 FL=1|jgi:hypothetical protein
MKKFFSAAIVGLFAVSVSCSSGDVLTEKVTTLENEVKDLQNELTVLNNAMEDKVAMLVEENPDLLRGPQGERGNKGTQGIQGKKGDQGEIGNQGVQGPLNVESLTRTELSDCAFDLLNEIALGISAANWGRAEYSSSSRTDGASVDIWIDPFSGLNFSNTLHSHGLSGGLFGNANHSHSVTVDLFLPWTCSAIYTP